MSILYFPSLQQQVAVHSEVLNLCERCFHIWIVGSIAFYGLMIDMTVRKRCQKVNFQHSPFLFAFVGFSQTLLTLAYYACR